MSPLSVIFLCIPSLIIAVSWRKFKLAFYLFISLNVGFRLFLLPFKWRAMKTMKKVQTVRVEHAIYGSQRPVRDYQNDRRLLFVIVSLLTALFGYWCYRDFSAALALVWDAAEFTKSAVPDEVILLWGWLIQASVLSWFESQSVFQMMPLVMWLSAMELYLPLALWLFISLVPMGIVDWYFGLRPFALDAAPWLIAAFLLGRLYKMSVGNIWSDASVRMLRIGLWLYFLSSKISNALRLVEIWHQDADYKKGVKWYEWLQSNSSTIRDRMRGSKRSAFSFKIPRFRNPWRKRDEFEKHMDTCVREQFEVRGKYGRSKMKICHPDKIKSLRGNFKGRFMSQATEACKQALGMVIGSGQQQRPAECA